MSVSAINQTVKHREKSYAESDNCPQEPHGKPDLSVTFNFSFHSGFHLGIKLTHSIANKVGVAKLYKFFHWLLK